MPLFQYTYVKNPVSTIGLTEEIRASSISVALERIDTVGSTLDIFFRAALSFDENLTLNSLVESHSGQFQSTVNPTDREGAMIIRTKAAAAGWSFQLHSLEFTTAKLGGYYNKQVNPTTGVETDLGFCTYKLFDPQGVEITSEENEGAAVHTRLDWKVNHDMEVRGTVYTHSANALQDCRLYVIAAPGIANIAFGQGGLNLKHVPGGQAFTAEGGTAKFLSATLPIVGVNRFRLLFKHPAGFQHSGQLHFMLYKQ